MSYSNRPGNFGTPGISPRRNPFQPNPETEREHKDSAAGKKKARSKAKLAKRLGVRK